MNDSNAAQSRGHISLPGQYDATGGIGVHPSNIAHYRIGRLVGGSVGG